MDRLAVIGVSHRRGGAEALAAWHERYLDARSLDPLGLGRAVVLATCNRWEAAVHLPDGISAAEARKPVGLIQAIYRSAQNGGARVEL